MPISKNMTKLYLRIKPYKKGYLSVSDGHELYYELCGNPNGIPVLFLHGGPGAGFTERSRRFFNPKKYNIILFDQRGAGKSRPFASIKSNTTWKLVQDIRRIMNFLNIEKVVLFGGSWGSTLALVYAICYPKSVMGMILRGIYLARHEDDFYFFNDPSLKPFEWKRFVSVVPLKWRKNFQAYYYKQMNSKNRKTRFKFIYEWSYYETSISKLNMTPEKIKRSLREFSYKSMSPIEAYYLKNHCFLQKNYILKNVHKIANIPTVIIHGKYDLICPPNAAYELYKKLKKVRLYFVLAGHSASEKEMEKKLVSEMNKFSRII